MFCLKCGHTLVAGANQCAYCGAEIGESALLGAVYTSAQPRILPGDDVAALLRGSSHPDRVDRAPETDDLFEAEQEEVYADEEPYTRPAPRYDEDLLPDDGLSQEAAESLDAVDDELVMNDLDMSRFRARDIETAGQSGISEDANQVIQTIEAKTIKRAQRRQRRQGNAEAAEETYDTESFADESLGYDQPAGAVDIDAAAETELVEGEEPYQFEEIEDYGEEGRRHLDVGRVLKFALVIAVVAALAVAGVLWVRYMRSNTSSSPIENVGQELYDSGLSLIKQHASATYEDEILTAFTDSGSNYAVLTSALSASQSEITALTPEEATDNESLFMGALTAIERNIGNCITADAMELDSTVDTGSTKESRWQVVNNSISILERATSAAQLSTIINGEVVTVATEAPVPTDTPAPNFNSLSKGDKSDDVKKLQQRLIDLGYLNDTADGNFGNKTQTALKIFQSAAGLSVTGVADEATQTALYADDAPTAAQAAGLDTTTGGAAGGDATVEEGDDLPDDGENVLDEDLAI